MPAAEDQKWFTHGWNRDLSWKLILGIVPKIPRFLRPPVHLATTIICFTAMGNERRAAARNLRVIRGGTAFSSFLASFKLFYKFSKFMVAYVDLPPYGKGLGDDRVEGRAEGRRVVEKALARGRGLIVVGAHLGQWDVALVELARMGVGITVVMRREDEEASRFAAAVREHASLKIAFAGEDPFMLVGLLSALRRNEIVAVQGDRLYGRKSMEVELFGNSSAIPRGPIDLAQASGAPLLPAAALLEGHGRYRLIFAEAIEAPPRRERGEAARPDAEPTAASLAAGLEALIRRDPEQWFNFFDFWDAVSPARRAAAPAAGPGPAERSGAGGLHDVAVIGGGPGGATAAALLARAGRDVVLLERDRFPRFHIGESLLPWNVAIFRKLGVMERLEERFIKKWGVEFLSSDGAHRSLFHFDEALDPRYPMSFQVARAEFDEILLSRAGELGAEVLQGACVKEAVEEADGTWRLTVERDGAASEVRARFLLDATGREGFLASRRGRRKMDPGFRKASVFSHYRGVPRREGRDEGNLVIILLDDGWFWFIPLAGGVTSVGLVTDGESIKRMKMAPADALARAIEACPVARDMMRDAERISEVWAASDWTYECERLAGDNFLLLGDSATFVDPVFSSGVLLAMKSGERAAGLVDAAFRDDDLDRRRFAGYEREVIRHARAYYRMVRSFYDGGFARMSFGNHNKNSIYRAVLNFLAGDMAPAWRIRWRLELFYWLAGAARRFKLGPELVLRPAFPRRETAS